MTILAYISGLLLGAAIMGLILIKITQKDLDDIMSTTDEAIDLAQKWGNQLIRVSEIIVDNSEKIGDELTTKLLDIISK